MANRRISELTTHPQIGGSNTFTESDFLVLANAGANPDNFKITPTNFFRSLAGTFSLLSGEQIETRIRNHFTGVEPTTGKGNVATGNLVGSIASTQIADGAVIASKIRNGNVTEDKISGSTTNNSLRAVTTEKIRDMNVTTAKLDDDSVTTVKIRNFNVTNTKIGNGAVSEVKLSGTSTNDSLRAVTENKIRDANVTERKLSGTSGNNSIAAVTSIKIRDSNVTAEKIAGSAVTTEKIRNRNVTEEKLIDGAVTTRKIRDGNVTAEKLADGAITVARLDRQVITSIDSGLSSRQRNANVLQVAFTINSRGGTFDTPIEIIHGTLYGGDTAGWIVPFKITTARAGSDPQNLTLHREPYTKGGVLVNTTNDTIILSLGRGGISQFSPTNSNFDIHVDNTYWRAGSGDSVTSKTGVIYPTLSNVEGRTVGGRDLFVLRLFSLRKSGSINRTGIPGWRCEFRVAQRVGLAVTNITDIRQ